MSEYIEELYETMCLREQQHLPYNENSPQVSYFFTENLNLNFNAKIKSFNY